MLKKKVYICMARYLMIKSTFEVRNSTELHYNDFLEVEIHNLTKVNCLLL